MCRRGQSSCTWLQSRDINRAHGSCDDAAFFGVWFSLSRLSDYLLSGGWLRIYITRPSLFCPKAHFQKPKKYALLCLDRLKKDTKRWACDCGGDSRVKCRVISCLSRHSCDLIWNINETNVTCQTQIVWSRRSERAWSRGSSPAKVQHRCTVCDIVKRFKWSHNKYSNTFFLGKHLSIISFCWPDIFENEFPWRNPRTFLDPWTLETLAFSFSPEPLRPEPRFSLSVKHPAATWTRWRAAGWDWDKSTWKPSWST